MIMEVHGRCRKDTFGGVGRKRQLYNILWERERERKREREGERERRMSVSSHTHTCSQMQFALINKKVVMYIETSSCKRASLLFSSAVLVPVLTTLGQIHSMFIYMFYFPIKIKSLINGLLSFRRSKDQWSSEKKQAKICSWFKFSFFFSFLYHEVDKLHMVTAHIKSQSNTQKRTELVHVIRWTQTSSKDKK